MAFDDGFMKGQQSPSGEELPEPPSVSSASLRIVKTGAAPLSKAQRAFNRLLSRIERLRADIEDETSRLDRALAYHVSTLHPLIQASTALRKELVRALAPYLTGKVKPALGKRQREALKGVLASQLETVAYEEGGLQEEDLQTLYTTTAGSRVGEAEAEAFAEQRAEMEEAFAEAGLDIDLSDLSLDASPEEILRKVAEVEEKLRQAEESGRLSDQEPAEAPRKKTRQQLAREERERQMAEARTRNLGAIYKQLARVLHPDLETDPTRKQEKETLMKRLTVAYKENDLHTLLRLELEWIHREHGDVARLSEGKLTIYNEVLKEQAEALREELGSLAWQPRYHALQRYVGPFGMFSFDGAMVKAQAEAVLRSIEESLARLRGPEAREEVLDSVRAYQEAMRQRPRLGAWAFE